MKQTIAFCVLTGNQVFTISLDEQTRRDQSLGRKHVYLDTD